MKAKNLSRERRRMFASKNSKKVKFSFLSENTFLHVGMLRSEDTEKTRVAQTEIYSSLVS